MPRTLSPKEQLMLIRKKMKGYSLEWVPKFILTTGSKRLNKLVGSERGIPAGKMVEIFGPESAGKSTKVYALIQRLVKNNPKVKFFVIWLDAENSWDERWGNTWSLYYNKSAPKNSGIDIALIQPHIVIEGLQEGKTKLTNKQIKELLKKKKVKIATAERMTSEAEKLMRHVYKNDPDTVILFVCDSITALLSSKEDDGEIEGQNLNTNTALSRFMSKLLRRWAGFFQTHNVLGFFINQTRMAPGVVYGDPTTTPGGKAMKFYAHSRIAVRRAGGGAVIQSGKKLGIKGIAKNKKNKLGGEEFYEIGYKIFSKGFSKYISAKDLKAESRDKSDE